MVELLRYFKETSHITQLFTGQNDGHKRKISLKSKDTDLIRYAIKDLKRPTNADFCCFSVLILSHITY